MWDLQVLECQQHQLIPSAWAGGTGLLSHFQQNTELSTRAPVEPFQAAQMWKNLYEMLKLESSRTYRCELTLE